MRISDWSSDVCSSDLREISAGFFVSMRRRQRYAGLRRDRGAVRVRAGAFEIPLRGDEIGRESCRERVCQNEWISEGAVAKKKKKVQQIYRTVMKHQILRNTYYIIII